jgi:hypothetical protein
VQTWRDVQQFAFGQVLESGPNSNTVHKDVELQRITVEQQPDRHPGPA